MFTVKKIDMTTKTFRLPTSLIERLAEVAQSQGVSMNNLVAQCCEYALDEMNDSNQTKNKNEMTINITQH